MKQIIVHIEKNMVQTALVESGQLIEMMVDKKDQLSSAGQVFAGIVKNILPSQFAFIDIGQEKNAFLHLNDTKEEALFVDKKCTLKIGQTLVVQVTKDPSGTKGAAVTTQLSFSGKNIVVFASDTQEIGISKKIITIGERKRLKKIAANMIKSIDSKGIGIILRTECQGKTTQALEEEFATILARFQKVTTVGQYIKAPANIYKEDSVLNKSVGNFIDREVDEIIIDNETRRDVVQAVAAHVGWQGEVSVYDGDVALFAHYGIDTQLEKALQKKAWLPSGGFLIIEQTEACVVIDVNTGKFLGSKNQQKTVVKTNMEASKEIAKQLRLRNLSGMIIIDFIDMKQHTDRHAVVAYLTEVVKQDRLAVSVLGLTHLGVVMLTRKKEREPIAQLLKTKCPTCHNLS